MALFDTALDHSIDMSGTLVAGEDLSRRYVAVQNKHLTTSLRLYLLPRGRTAPVDMDADYMEIAPGKVWFRGIEVCPANAIYLASSNRTVTALVDIQTG